MTFGAKVDHHFIFCRPISCKLLSFTILSSYSKTHPTQKVYEWDDVFFSLNSFLPIILKAFHGAVKFDWTCGRRYNTSVSVTDAERVYFFLYLSSCDTPSPTATSCHCLLPLANICLSRKGQQLPVLWQRKLRPPKYINL